jgi:hypothetical protein
VSELLTATDNGDNSQSSVEDGNHPLQESEQINSTGSFSQETITHLDTIHVSLFNPGGHPLDSHCRTSNGVLADHQLYLPCDVYRYHD